MAENETTEKRVYSVPRLAEALEVSDQQIYNMIGRGELKAFRVGRRIVVPVAEVERFEREALARGAEVSA